MDLIALSNPLSFSLAPKSHLRPNCTPQYLPVSQGHPKAGQLHLETARYSWQFTQAPGVGPRHVGCTDGVGVKQKDTAQSEKHETSYNRGKIQ